MNDDYPRMLYRKGDSKSTEYHGFPCDTRVVDDPDEEAAVTGEGWRRTPAEAHGKEPEAPIPDTLEAKELQDERDSLAAEVDQLRKDLETIQRGNVELTEQLKAERQAREAAEKERDESRELIAAFDRDNNGKPGGSKPKEKAG